MFVSLDVPLTWETGIFEERVGGRFRILFLLTEFVEENAPPVGVDTVGGGGRGFIGCRIGGCECGGLGLFGGIGEEVCSIGGPSHLLTIVL